MSRSPVPPFPPAPLAASVGCWLTPRLLLVALALLASCSSTSFAYRASGVRHADIGSAGPKIVFGGMLPGAGLAPDVNRFHGVEGKVAWQQIEDSTHKHLIKAGIVVDETRSAPSPRTPQDAQRLLTSLSRRNDVDALLLVRPEMLGVSGSAPTSIRVSESLMTALTIVGGAGLLPMLLVTSLPVRSERIAVRMRGTLIDIDTQRLLWSGSMSSRYSGSASFWGFHPAGELAPVLKKAVQGLIDEMSTALREGRRVESNGSAVEAAFRIGPSTPMTKDA